MNTQNQSDAKFRVPPIILLASVWNRFNDWSGLPWRFDYWQAAKIGGGSVDLGLTTQHKAEKRVKKFGEPIVFIDKTHKIVVYGHPPEMRNK